MGNHGKVPHGREQLLPHFGCNAGTFRGSGGAPPYLAPSRFIRAEISCIRNELLNERFNRRSKLGRLNGAISKMLSLILLNINIMDQILGTRRRFRHEKARAWQILRWNISKGELVRVWPGRSSLLCFGPTWQLHRALRCISSCTQTR